MLISDLYFSYKYNFRYILINKLNYLSNTYNISQINKLILFFSLKKLDDIDQIQLYNSFYLFKFFLGKNAFFSKINKFFSLGNWYFNFNIQIILNNKKDILNILYFFFNNIFNNIEKNFLKIGFINKKLNIFYFIIKDINIYSELKTNYGLFNIKSKLNINLYLIGGDFLSSDIFIKLIKK